MARLHRRLLPALIAALLGGLALFGALPTTAEDEPSPAKDPDKESIFQLIAPRAGEVIADVGCGKGTWTFPLARAVGAHGRIYAVDINPRKIEKVEARIADENVTNVKVIHSVKDNPMLKANSLDAVFVNDVINHVDRSALAGFLVGIRNALKPSGRLIIRDPNGGPGRVVAECYRYGFTLIEAKVPLENVARPSFTTGWYALKLLRADRMPPALLPRLGKPSRHFTRLHLVEELYRLGVLTREELGSTWEPIETAPGEVDPTVAEPLDLINAAEAIGVLSAKTATKLRGRVKKP